MNSKKHRSSKTRPAENWLLRLAALLRKKFTVRQLRYLFALLILSRVPWLRRRYSVYAHRVSLSEFAAGRLAQEELTAKLDLSDLGADYLAWYQGTPNLLPMHEGSIELRLGFMAHMVDDCMVLPRSPAILHRPSERLVLCPGCNAGRNVVRPVRYRATESVPGLSIPMVAGTHYYHFFFDQLLLLQHTLAMVPAARSATVLINEHMLPFQQAGYDILRREFPDLRFRPVKRDVKLHCERLLVPCHLLDGHIINWFAPMHLLHKVAQSYRDHYNIQSRKPERLILISRKHQKLRRLINEDALYEQLAPLGFELVVPEKLPHEEQVALFTSARILIGGSGAALTNLLFCQPGGTVIEMFPGNIYKPFWIGLSKQMGLKHHIVGSNHVNLHEGFSIDPERVLDIVRQILEPPATALNSMLEEHPCA